MNRRCGPIDRRSWSRISGAIDCMQIKAKALTIRIWGETLISQPKYYSSLAFTETSLAKWDNRKWGSQSRWNKSDLTGDRAPIINRWGNRCNSLIDFCLKVLFRHSILEILTFKLRFSQLGRRRPTINLHLLLSWWSQNCIYPIKTPNWRTAALTMILRAENHKIAK